MLPVIKSNVSCNNILNWNYMKIVKSSLYVKRYLLILNIYVGLCQVSWKAYVGVMQAYVYLASVRCYQLIWLNI